VRSNNPAKERSNNPAKEPGNNPAKRVQQQAGLKKKSQKKPQPAARSGFLKDSGQGMLIDSSTLCST
jgi:hypothetical protein